MRRGFTLIELLAVIVILAVISLIAVPTVMNMIEESRVGALKQSNDSVIKAAQNYIVKNDELLPRDIGDTIELSLSKLIDNNVLSEFNNPFGSGTCSGYVLITKTNSGHEYVPHINCFEDISSSEEDGLLAYYKLDNNVIDYSLNNNQGTLTNVEATNDRFGNEEGALSFDGSSSFVLIPSLVAGELHGGEEATLSMWIKLNSSVPSVARSGVIQLSGFNTTNGNLYPYQGDKLYLDIFRTNRIGPMYYPNIDLTEWHNLVVTAKPGSNGWRVYLNGVLIHSTTGQNIVTTNHLEFRIGNNSSSRWLHGDISDVSLYKRSLSQDEVEFLYKANR